MADTFEGMATGATSPAPNAVAVTPGATELTATTRGIYVGTGGDLTVTMLGGGDVTFPSVPGGAMLAIRVTHVLAASTATDIVALW